MTHTPGPWSVGADSIFQVDSPKDQPDILFIDFDDPILVCPNPEDRLLIEAAPYLLEACIAVSASSSEDIWDTALALVDVALAKTVVLECLECGEVHRFPVQKFRPGDRVVIVSDVGGFHNLDRVGDTFAIRGVNGCSATPCDEVEYFLEGLEGAVLESRLKKQDS